MSEATTTQPLLPLDIQFLIIDAAEWYQHATLSQVCKSWREATNSHKNTLKRYQPLAWPFGAGSYNGINPSIPTGNNSLGSRVRGKGKGLQLSLPLPSPYLIHKAVRYHSSMQWVSPKTLSLNSNPVECFKWTYAISHSKDDGLPPGFSDDVQPPMGNFNVNPYLSQPVFCLPSSTSSSEREVEVQGWRDKAIKLRVQVTRYNHQQKDLGSDFDMRIVYAMKEGKSVRGLHEYVQTRLAMHIVRQALERLGRCEGAYWRYCVQYAGEAAGGA